MTFARDSNTLVLLFSGVLPLPFVMLIVGVGADNYIGHIVCAAACADGHLHYYSLAAHLENKPIPFEPRWWM